MDATLTDLLQAIGPPTLVPWAVPAPVAGVPVCDVVIPDRTAPGPLDVGAVVLAVGHDPSEAEALVRSAAEQQAAAVVVRAGPEQRARLSPLAEAAGIALLAVSPAVGWADFASLLRNAVLTSADHVSDSHLDLTAVANNLAAAVNGSVLVFNPGQEILAASRLRPEDDLMRRRAVADQRGPAEYREHLRELGVYRQLWGEPDVVDIPSVPRFEAGRRLAVAIRAGEEILGSIWVAEGGGRLSPDAADILRSAAASASGHLAWLNARAQTQRRFAEGLLAQLLAGDADVDAAARWLDVAVDESCVVVLATTADPGLRRRLSDQMTLHFSAFRSVPRTALLHDAVALVLAGVGDPVSLRATLPEALERVSRAMDVPVLAAVGDAQETLRSLPESRRRAEEVLAALRRRTPDGRTRVATYDEVRNEVCVDRLHRHVREAEDLEDGAAGLLVRWDEQHGTEYADSVLAFLDAHGSVADAAGRIHVHPNTVRYRLRRAEQIVGLRLDDASARLVAHLELAVLLSDRTGTDARTWASA